MWGVLRTAEGAGRCCDLIDTEPTQSRGAGRRTGEKDPQDPKDKGAGAWSCCMDMATLEEGPFHREEVEAHRTRIVPLLPTSRHIRCLGMQLAGGQEGLQS